MTMGKSKEFTNPSGLTPELLERYDPIVVRRELVNVRSDIPRGRKPRPHGSKRHQFYVTDHEYLAVLCFIEALRKKEVFKQLVED
jgi:hypothetical protein